MTVALKMSAKESWWRKNQKLIQKTRDFWKYFITVITANLQITNCTRPRSHLFFNLRITTYIHGNTILPYSHNFERILKSMIFVQIESIYIDSFGNVIKNSRWYPFAMLNSQNPRKVTKNVFTPAKISQDGEIV